MQLSDPAPKDRLPFTVCFFHQFAKKLIPRSHLLAPRYHSTQLFLQRLSICCLLRSKASQEGKEGSHSQHG
jgi:hypothetical protein